MDLIRSSLSEMTYTHSATKFIFKSVALLSSSFRSMSSTRNGVGLPLHQSGLSKLLSITQPHSFGGIRMQYGLVAFNHIELTYAVLLL